MEQEQRGQQKSNQQSTEGTEHNSSNHAAQRKKKAYKKAPDAPKRFKSAYICFVTDKMEVVKSTLPADVKVTEVMKVLAYMWKNLPPLEKLEYEKIARADKSRYLDELQNYNGPMQVPNKRQKKPADAPRRGMSAFLSYSQEMRPKMRERYPQLKNTDISSLLAQQWHAASDDDKRPHVEKEIQQREKYYEDMAKWKAEEDDRKKIQEIRTSAPGAPFCKTQLDFMDIGTAARLNNTEFWSSIENKLGSYEPNDTETSAIDRMNTYLSDVVEKDSNVGDDSVNEFWDHGFAIDLAHNQNMHISNKTNPASKLNKKKKGIEEVYSGNENSSSRDGDNPLVPSSINSTTQGSIKRSRKSPSEAKKVVSFSSINSSSAVNGQQMESEMIVNQSYQQQPIGLCSSHLPSGQMAPSSGVCYYQFPFNLNADPRLTAEANAAAVSAVATMSVDGTQSNGITPAMIPSYALGFYLAKLQQQFQMEQQIHQHQQQQQQARHIEEMQLQRQQIDQQQRILNELYAQNQILQQRSNNSSSSSTADGVGKRSKNSSRMRTEQKSEVSSISTPSMNETRSDKTTSESGSSRSGDSSRSGSNKNLSNIVVDNGDPPLYTYNMDRFRECEHQGPQVQNLMEETHSSFGRTKHVSSTNSTHAGSVTHYQTINSLNPNSLNPNMVSEDLFQKESPLNVSIVDQHSQLLSKRLHGEFSQCQQIQKAFPLPPLYEQTEPNCFFPQLHTTSNNKYVSVEKDQSSTGVRPMNEELLKNASMQTKNTGLDSITNPSSANDKLLNSLIAIPNFAPPLKPLCHAESSLSNDNSSPFTSTSTYSAISSLQNSIAKDSNQGNYQILSNASSILASAFKAGLEDVPTIYEPRSSIPSSKPRVSIALEYNKSHYLSDESCDENQEESTSDAELNLKKNQEFVK